MRVILTGAVDQTIYLAVAEDSGGTNPGEPKTGLVFGDITSASYVRTRGARVAITPITLASASAAHADGGFILVDDTNMPGLYRFDIPDAAVATGADQVVIHMVFAGGVNSLVAPLDITINLQDVVWDEQISAHVQAGSYGQAMRALFPLNGQVVAGTPLPTVFDTDVTGFNNDDFIDSILVFLEGGNIAQARRVTKHSASTGTISVAPGFRVAPATNDKFVLIHASVARGVADAVWEEIFTELTSVPGVSPAAAEAMTMIYMALRNKIVTDSGAGTTKIHNDAGTAIGSAVVADAAGVFSREKYT